MGEVRAVRRHGAVIARMRRIGKRMFGSAAPLLLAATLVLAALVFMAERASSDANASRKATARAADKLERFTNSILNDAYAVRAPAAVRSEMSRARQDAIKEIIRANPAIDTTTLDILLEVTDLDSVVAGHESQLGGEIAKRGFDVS